MKKTGLAIFAAILCVAICFAAVVMAEEHTHNYGEWNVRNAATCVNPGAKVRMCEECGNVETDVIPATGHTEVVDAAVAADCVNTGKTEGKHCSVCKAVLVKQEVVPAKGHTEKVLEAVEATCKTAGLTEGKACSECGEILVAQEEVAPTKHVYFSKKFAATLTKQGYVRYTCNKCGASYNGKYTDAFADTMGSIVFNAADEAMPYVVTEEDSACVITAEADADGAYTLRKLVLAADLINALADLDITEIRFVVGEYTLVIPMDIDAQEAVCVFTVEPSAEGCFVKAEAKVEETANDITAVVAGLKLIQGETVIDVTESKIYVFEAE